MRNKYGLILKLIIATVISFGLMISASASVYAEDDIADGQSGSYVEEDSGSSDEQSVSDPQSEPETPAETSEGTGGTLVETPEETPIETPVETPVEPAEEPKVSEVTETPAETPAGTDDALIKTQEESPADLSEGSRSPEKAQTPDENRTGTLSNTIVETEVETSAQSKTAVIKNISNGESNLDKPETPTLLATSKSKTAASANKATKSPASTTPVILSSTPDSTVSKSKTISIAILSDTHYISNDQREASESSHALVDLTARTEIRMLEEIDGIITVALNQVKDSTPDVLLVCGDLTSNGEYSGAQALAAKLKALKNVKGMENLGIYVVNGNHDINNSYAADYTLDPSVISSGQRISPDDFKSLFDGLGYGDGDYCKGGSRKVYNPSGDVSSKPQNHGGLSYVTEIAKGVSLIVMDTGVYSYEDLVNSRYSEAQQTIGYVSDGLLEWVVEQAAEQKAKGNLVLAMCHHSLMPHYSYHTSTMDSYMESFVISNYEKVSNALADAGVTAVLTGHSHANDIARYVSENGNVIYDIQTAAMCAYPVAWRTVNIEITGSGDDAIYDFSIDTHFLDKDFDDVDTSRWKTGPEGEEKTFADFDGSMQDYSYEKSGIRKEVIEPAIDYLLKPIAYEIATGDAGLAGYLKDKLGIKDGSDVGAYLTDKVIAFFDEHMQISTDINVLGSNIHISASKEKGGKDDHIIKYDMNIESKGVGKESAVVSIDLTGFATGINNMIASLNDKIKDGGWTQSNYLASPIQKEINKLLSNVLITALSKPVKRGESVTGFTIANDAYQAFAKGDEGEVQTQKRKYWNQLIKGDDFAGIVKNAAIDEIKKIAQDDDAYPLLQNVLKTRLISEGKESILTINGSGTMIDAVKAILGNSLDSLNKIIYQTGSVWSYMLPNSIAGFITKPLAEIQESMTQDTIIPKDSVWDFHTVLFYPNYGDEAAIRSLTVEGYRTGYYPIIYRDGYTFEGWFTDAVDGNPVGSEDDLRGIYRLYAHWIKNDPDPDPDPDSDFDPESEWNLNPYDYWDDYWEDYWDDYYSYYEYMDYLAQLSLYLETLADYTNGDLQMAEAAKLMAMLPAGVHIEGNRILDNNGNEIKSGLFVTDAGLLGINIMESRVLPPELVSMIRLLNRDIAIFYMYQGRWYVIIIPAGTELPVDEAGYLHVEKLLPMQHVISNRANM